MFWFAYASCFLKSKRHIDMLLSLPISHLRIFQGDPKWQPFGEFRTDGICQGSTAWIISCERLWWKPVTLALYLISQKKGGVGEDYGVTHSMANNGQQSPHVFWCFHWSLGLGHFNPEVDRDKWVQLGRILTSPKAAMELEISEFFFIKCLPLVKLWNISSKWRDLPNSNVFRLHDAGAQLGFGEDMSQRMKRTTSLGGEHISKELKPMISR